VKAKTYATVLAIVVLSAVSGEFLIFASNLRTRHRAEALLTAVRHLRLGQPRSELQWLLSEYDAAAAESSAPPAPSLKGLFTIPPSPAPKTPAVPYPEGANVPLHSQETYFIYAFPRAVNKIASASLLLWKLGVVPWAVEVRLELEEGKCSAPSKTGHLS